MKSEQFFESKKITHGSESNDSFTCKGILEDVKPGLSQRLTPKNIKKIITEIQKNKMLMRINQIIMRVKIIIFQNLKITLF